MANWCNNSLLINGKEEQVSSFLLDIKEMYNRYEKEQQGVLPLDFTGEMSRYWFFTDDIWDIENNQITFETKWAPPIESVEFLAKKHNVSIELFYEELGNLIYGCFSYNYETKESSDIYLEDDDFDKYTSNYEESIYFFEGEEYESEYEILETILERKIKSNNKN